MRPLTFYRTSGALRFTPSFDRSVIFLDAARALEGIAKVPQPGEKRYNWEDRITLALSPEEGLDLAAICEAIRVKGKGEFDIYHDPTKGGREGSPKKLSLNTTKGKVFLAVESEDLKVAFSLTYRDLFTLERYLSFVSMKLYESGGFKPTAEEEPPFNY